MSDDWNNHIYSSDTADNGIVSDVRIERIGTGSLNGTINIEVREYTSLSGYKYHNISYDYYVYHP